MLKKFFPIEIKSFLSILKYNKNIDLHIDNKFLLKSLNYSRFLIYTIEGYPILFLRKFFGLNRKPNPPPPKDHEKKLFETIRNMIDEDIKNIENKLYSEKLIFPENPLRHSKRYLEIVKDYFYSSLRAKKNEYNKFSPEIKKDIQKFPEYYQRNFHFQTDGYLSKESAKLYSHQTEILFKGSLALTRRLLMSELIKYIQNQNRTLKILELACGSGDSTHILLSSCKNIELTAIDLSHTYISQAKIKTRDFSNVKYKVQDATKLNTMEEKFDVVFSVYLFHEMPEKERNQVVNSSYEQLNNEGFMMNIDSIQLNDIPEFNWALLNFPQDFHEPFYMNYIKRPLENIMKDNKLKKINTNIRFLSKSVCGIK